MHDRVLASLIFVPVAIIVLLILAMIAVDIYRESPNPLEKIPKVIMDFVDNETVVSVIAVGEVRYDEIHINYTVEDHTFTSSVYKRYSLDVGIAQRHFTVNVTAKEGSDVYMFNATVGVDLSNPSHPYFDVREEGDSGSSRHRSPYTTLAQWRDL